MLIKEIVLYLRQCSRCLLRILKALVTQMGFALSLWPRLAAEFFPQILDTQAIIQHHCLSFTIVCGLS